MGYNSIKKTIMKEIKFTHEGQTLCYEIDETTKTASVVQSRDNKISGDVIIPKEITYNNTTYPVTVIDSWAFKGCKELTSIEIPESVTIIGNSAFWGCEGLRSIEIPSSVTFMGPSVFEKCKNLKSVELSNSITKIYMETFRGCSSLEFVEIPESVTTIGGLAFEDCNDLVRVDIPASVTSIGGKAFCRCHYIEEIYSKSSIPPTAEEDSFDEVPNGSMVIYVPKGSKDSYKKATGWKKFLNIKEYNF